MVKLTGPLLSISAHGQIGPRLTFIQRKTGATCRYQKSQKDRKSSAQLEQRALYRIAVDQWNALSEEEKQTYNTRTEQERLPMTGFNLFLAEHIGKENDVGALNTDHLLHIQDQKAQGTGGGGFTSGAWRTRDLNTKLTDNIDGASLSSNQITLPAGTYYVEARAPAFLVARHATRFYNVTDDSLEMNGTIEYGHPSTGQVQTISFISGPITITAQKVFEVQHRCETTRASNGFGVKNEWSGCVFTDIKIWKV